jgi:hypothetical protein
VCFVDAFVYHGSRMRTRRLGAYKLQCRVAVFGSFLSILVRDGNGN